MREVYTYSDLDSLKSAPFYEELHDKIHIGSSMELNKKMSTEGYFMNDLSFREIYNSIDPQWNSDETRIYNMTLITEYLRTLITNSKNQNEIIWLEGCFKEIFLIWSSIEVMEEANLKPNMIQDSDENIRLMCDVWSHLIEYGDTITRYRYCTKKKNLIPKIKKILKSYSYSPEDNIIVIHGFYYFTPIQERIMIAMEEAGYILKFLIPYDHKYPHANEIWTLLYRSENGYKDKNNWINAFSENFNCFGAVFDNEDIKECSLRLVEYGDIVEMVDDFEKISSEDCAIYSADSAYANEILRDFFPEKYGTRTLLSYPIGQFVFTLHKMWDQESQSLLIEPKYISECFASGWASHGDLNSKDYVYDLQKILPFFENCTSVYEWNKRLQLLHSINKDVVSVFKSDSECNTTRRWENVMGNPFSNFSMFDVEDERLDSIILLITKLIDNARELFGSEEGIRLNEHFGKLSDILYERGKSSEELNSELKDISDILERMIKTEGNNVFYPEDIAQTVTYFLAGDFATTNHEGKYVEDWVKPITEIDGNLSEKVHICLSDLNTLPGKPQNMVWPLTKASIRDLYFKLADTEIGRLLWHMMFILDKLPQINRYMVFSAFRNKHITMSWISEFNQKLYAPSPYISLLSRYYGLRIEKESDLRFAEEVLNSIPEAEQAVTGYFISELDIIPDARREYAVCPKRYLYSYLLNENPTFKSEFLQNFAIGGFIKSLIELQKEGGFDKGLIEERVFELFPGKLSIIKQNIIDRSAAVSYKNTTTRYNGREYTDLRYDVRFPITIRESAEERLKNLNFNLERNITIGTGNENECRYCPHSEYCPEAGRVYEEKL